MLKTIAKAIKHVVLGKSIGIEYTDYREPMYSGSSAVVHADHEDDVVHIEHTYNSTAKRVDSDIYCNGEYIDTISIRRVCMGKVQYTVHAINTRYGGSRGIADLRAHVARAAHIEAGIGDTRVVHSISVVDTHAAQHVYI